MEEGIKKEGDRPALQAEPQEGGTRWEESQESGMSLGIRQSGIQESGTSLEIRQSGLRESGTSCGIRQSESQESGSAGGTLAGILEAFPGKRQDIRTYSPLTLAYIGDAVYDLIIRTVVVERANRPANELHHTTVKYVSANAQSRIVRALMEYFTDEEQTIYRRGKNSKPHTTAKNASVTDYLKATGFEAVIGYLYLTDRMDRVLELVKKGLELAGMKI